MSDFKKLAGAVFASPQLSLDDVAAAKEAGIALIINNRPDGEDPSAPQGDAIEAAAKAAGIAYCAIPIGHSGFSEAQIAAMQDALTAADGPALAYCRSGTRSTFLWALAEAKSGGTPDDIVKAAYGAGYDISPVRPMLDMLAAQ